MVSMMTVTSSSHPSGRSAAVPPGRMKLWFMRRPVVFSKKPRTISRSRKPKIIMVVEPEVHAVGGQPHQVRGHPLELGQQHADPDGPGRQLDAEQRLGGQGEDELVGERRQVVHAGDVGGPLLVGELLPRLLHARVQVADDRLRPQHRLAVELHHQPQHAVGRRVLGPEVDDHGLVVGRLEVDVVGVPGRVSSGTRSTAPPPGQLVGAGRRPGQQLLAALVGLPRSGPAGVVRSTGRVPVGRRVRRVGAAWCASGPSSGPGRFFELHGDPADAVVLAQGVALPVLGHEDPGRRGGR